MDKLSWLAAGAVLLLPACEVDRTANQAVEANAPAEAEVAANATELAANAAAGNRTADAAGSILAWSKPAAGSTVSAPVNQLVFHFSPPARLGEVTVAGPDGLNPIMVTAVGETEHYELPLDGLGAGGYTVNWRASAQGRDDEGSFGFTVR